MTKSIKVKYAMIFSALLAFTLIVCWICNVAFLGRFYIARRIKILQQTYTVLDSASNTYGLESDEFKTMYESLSHRYNFDILILDTEMNILASNVMDNEGLSEKLLGYFFRKSDNVRTILTEDKYSIQISADNTARNDFIELWGVMSSGNPIVMTAPISGIRDSAYISNMFMAYIGILAILISVLATFKVSKTITQPILKLADISERMANLDFNAKYEGNDKNEIGLLGERMNQLSSTLEKTISELKSANNELKLDLERKNEIDEMRREFLSNVSHELKTPIALIQGYAEGLIDCVNDDEESKNFYCEVIADEADKMNRLVKSLMQLNEMESGANAPSIERFDIIEMIRNSVGSFDIMLKQNEIKYILNQSDPLYVWSDEFIIEQVFDNFFSNAIHYSKGEEKIIEVRVTNEDNKKIRVEVYNSGDTIPEEDIDRLWDKFYKVDKARSREYGGSGVGLSIVKAGMESLNQNYGVTNYESGVGFFFEVDGDYAD